MNFWKPFVRPTFAVPMLLAFVGTMPAADSPTTNMDEAILKEVGIGTDSAALLAFFRQRTALAADKDRLAVLVRQLGDASFAARRKAAADLLAAGPAARSLLEAATRDADRERARQARECLAEIDKTFDPRCPEAGARLLAARKVTRAIPVLLSYLPFAEDEAARRIIRDSLAILCKAGPDAASALRAAATDSEPTRRATAARLLGGTADTEQQRVLSRLLADPDPSVRLEAACGLARAGDKKAVAVLITLLTDAPPRLAWRAEELLLRLAGASADAPALQPTEASRHRCHTHWQTWWAQNGRTVSLASLADPDKSRPLILIADLDEGRLLAFDFSWRPCWRIEDLAGPVHCEPLPSGRFLLAENHGQRVTERDRRGRIVWQHTTRGYPVSCWRAEDGNTFIATNEELLEVTPEGKEVWSHKRPEGIWYARPVRHGRIALLTAGKRQEGGLDKSCMVTISRSGEELQRFEVGLLSAWSSFTILPNDHCLVAESAEFSLPEFDRQGKKCRQYEHRWAANAAYLPTGNLLICEASEANRRVVEVNPAGKIVHEQKTSGRPWHVQILP
jgi:HEAT repeat protein